ncbi:hypothetical protein DL93DRAFT_714405 [Clavulina sp. PMI_390]|nr:hypothetical protein DL93DRAFT_714405 [Clavulina sp. PMI_390]
MSELVVSTLNDVATSADAFPPLKSAADGALWVANHVKTTKHDKAEWAALANYIQQAIASISLVASKQGPPFTPAFEAHLRALETAVNTVTTDMQSYLVSKSLIKRVKGHLHFRDRRRIRFYTETMDRALALFNLGNTATGQDVFFHLVEHSSGPHTTVIKAPAPALLEDAPREVVDTTSHKANIELLPYASGAAWNPHHVGLPGTQITLIEDVMSFIRNGRTAPCSQVLVLEGPAGFGKTSLANSVAKVCVEADDVTLLSSFFFPKRSAERNPHDLLFTTIARDLASKTGSLALAQAISKAIDGDKSLLSPPLAQQFEHLLLHPIKTVFPPIAATHDSVAPSILEATSVLSIPETVVLTVRDPAAPSTLDTSRPLVVIVDALEEGYSEDLLRVLAEGIPNLPPSFRFVVTCRPSLSLSSTLHSASQHHVVIRKLEQDADYTEDVVSYARHSLARVREARGLESHWPGEDVEDAFAMRAREGGGSFAWVSSICDYLSTRSVNPTGQLEKLVARGPVVASRFADMSGGQGQGLGVLYEKLDQRYADVLLDAPWEDEEFVQGYQRVIGGLLCVKEPLDIHSIDIVLGGTGVGGVKAVDVLRPLAPLLKGLDHPGAVVQIAHPSMRDFILHRANTASSKYPQYSKFALDPNATEEALALRMLHLLNTHLPLIYLPSTTPLSTPSPSTPKLLAPDLPHTPQPRSRTNSILTASGLSRPRVMSSGVSFLGANAVPLPPSPPVFLNGAGKRASYAPLSQNTPSSSPSPIRSLSASVGPLLNGNGKGNRPRSPSEAANPTRPPLSLGEAGSSQAMSLSNTTNSSVGPGMQHHHHQHRPSLSSPLSFTSLRVRAGSVAEYHRSSAPKFHFGFTWPNGEISGRSYCVVCTRRFRFMGSRRSSTLGNVSPSVGYEFV